MRYVKEKGTVSKKRPQILVGSKDKQTMSFVVGQKQFKITVNKPSDIIQTAKPKRKIKIRVENRSRDADSGSIENCSKVEKGSRGTAKSIDSDGNDNLLHIPVSNNSISRKHKRTGSNCYTEKQTMITDLSENIKCLETPKSSNNRMMRKSFSCAKSIKGVFSLPPLPSKPPVYKQKVPSSRKDI